MTLPTWNGQPVPTPGPDAIKTLRGYIAEPDATKYTDEDLVGYISGYAIRDANGTMPAFIAPSTGLMQPPQLTWDPYWIPSWDLHSAAAEIWGEKRAALAVDNFDFSADGASYTRSQKVKQAQEMELYHRSRRKAKSISLRPNTQRETFPHYILANGPEWI